MASVAPGFCGIGSSVRGSGVRVWHITSRGWDPWTERPPPEVVRVAYPLSEGININITLLFSVGRYREVMEVYISALERRVTLGQPIDRIQSVASFFISRVDSNVDAKLDAIARDVGRSNRNRRRGRSLQGKVAIANARMAFQAFEGIFQGPRFAKLAEKGGHVPRPLWASTSTKDPAYPGLYYVEALVAPGTVDTMPPEALEAYKREGAPVVRIYDDLPCASAVFDDLAQLSIDAWQVSLELEEEGAQKFAGSYDKVLRAIERKEQALRAA